MVSLRALVIEDERDTARLVAFHLRGAGFDVEVAETGAAGLERATTWLPHVIMLDVRLPDISGFDVCSELRKQGAATAATGVLMMTAHGLTDDRVKAFELGADDYLIKPFVVRELVLRATALARRTAPPKSPARQILRCGAIEYDPRTLQVSVAGAVVELRASELRLLQVFLERPGEVFHRKDLLRKAWGNSVPASSRVVDITVYRLRVALGEHA